jgi:endonuclease G
MKTKDFDNTGPKEALGAFGEGDTASVLERIIDESDLLPVYFLEQGARVQRSVARVVLTKPHRIGSHTFPPGTGWATGFLVAPSLFLTNNHVIPHKDFASKIRMQFNYQLGPDGTEQATESYFPAPSEVYRTNPSLDYTLIRLRPNQVVDDPFFGNRMIQPGERWGFIPLNESPTYLEKQHFNVIQHPSGRRKEVALQNNEIEALFQNVVRYTTDTEPGSSGSPVFNNLWELVALHHAGGEQDETGKWVNNQGIRLDKIVEDLRVSFGNGEGEQVLEELRI